MSVSKRMRIHKLARQLKMEQVETKLSLLSQLPPMATATRSLLTELCMQCGKFARGPYYQRESCQRSDQEKQMHKGVLCATR